jgi:membrane protease YdiL (CAAX protease family)
VREIQEASAMIDFVLALLLWLAVFVPSSVIASISARKSPRRAGFMMQLTMLLLSLTAMKLLGGFERFGFVWSDAYTGQAFVLGFAVSLILNLFAPSEPMPGFLPEGAWKFFLLLLLAPLSEETLNRGLLGSYLLNHGHFWGAMGKPISPRIVFCVSGTRITSGRWAIPGRAVRARRFSTIRAKSTSTLPKT